MPDGVTCQRCGGPLGRQLRPVCQSCVSILKAQDYAWCCSEKHKGNRSLPLSRFGRASNGRKHPDCKKCAINRCACGTQIRGGAKRCAPCRKVHKAKMDKVYYARWRDQHGLLPDGAVRGKRGAYRGEGRRVPTDDEIADKDYSPRGEAEKEAAVRWLLRPELPKEWFG